MCLGAQKLANMHCNSSPSQCILQVKEIIYPDTDLIRLVYALEVSVVVFLPEFFFLCSSCFLGTLCDLLPFEMPDLSMHL